MRQIDHAIGAIHRAHLLPVVKHMNTGRHHPVAGVQSLEHRHGFLAKCTDPHRDFFKVLLAPTTHT